VCGPVRKAVHRSHEKKKQIQVLKQGHQEAKQQNQQQQQPPPPFVAASVQPMQPGQPRSRPRSSSSRSQSLPTSEGRLAAEYRHLFRCLVSVSILQFSDLWLILVKLNPGAIAKRVNGNTGCVCNHQAAVAGQPVVPGVAYSNGQGSMPKHAGRKPREDHTLINCFSIKQIETHLESLNNGLQLPPLKLKQKCLENVKVLQSHQHGWVFNTPVDPVELGLPDYFEVIKRPMDLGTIRKRLENGCYHSLEDFEADCNLTFNNAMTYNPEGSDVYNLASEMKEKFRGRICESDPRTNS
jgi:E1A/CREB-binding protein